MIKNTIFMFAILVLNPSVFAAQASSTESRMQPIPSVAINKESASKIKISKIARIYGRYPFYRSRRSNIETRIFYDAKTFKYYVDLSSMVADKRSRARRNSVYGDQRDNVDIQTHIVSSFGKVTPQSDGDSMKHVFSNMSPQSARKFVSFYASFSGKLAAQKLDVSEKLEQGSGGAVRAYPEGEAYMDQGYVLNLEARILLPTLFERQQVESQLIGFVDTGTMTVNKNTWVDGLNRRALNGAGIGLNFSYINNFELKAYYANALGNGGAALAHDSSGLFWILALKYF